MTGQSIGGEYAFPVHLVAPGTGIFHRKSEASIVERSDGVLLLAYGRYRNKQSDFLSPIEGDNDKAAIAAIELNSDGQVIGEERVLVPEPKQGLNVMSPALRRLPDGRIGMVYSDRIGKKEARRVFVASEDEGFTWSEPVLVADGAYKTGCHDRLTVLSSGVLIAPLHCTEDWDRHYLHARVARSSDGGSSWTLSDPVELPPVGSLNKHDSFTESGCVEPGVAEREDGSLLMVLRTAMGTLFASESFDEGATWTAPYSMEVISPQAPAHLSRIPGTADLLLVWTPDYRAGEHLGGRRHTIMACVSKDGGRSWPHSGRKALVRDPGRHTDYPHVFFMGEEAWITLRIAEGPGILEGRVGTGLMKVPVDWFYE